jgi:hypothetical protein
MISTSKLIGDISQVPRQWVFEYYLNLSEKLVGQDVKILSVFNRKDKIPSMCVYMDVVTGHYKFKDFSSGFQGDHIELVKHLFNLPSRYIALNKIVDDYQEYVTCNSAHIVTDIKFHDRYKVVDYEMRHWNNLDQKFWMSFKIGSKLLDYYNVVPLEYFKMEKKEESGSISSITIQKNYIYGYFRNDGSLYKIYMPKTIDKKFIKVANYIQGADQLTFKKDYLVVTSSLKDLMAFRKLGYKNAEAIAPDSENSMISESIINKLKTQYKSICVLFDNDSPGINSAKKYQEKYGFKYIVFPVEKDLSDAVKAIGVTKVKEQLYSYLKEALT